MRSRGSDFGALVFGLDRAMGAVDLFECGGVSDSAAVVCGVSEGEAVVDCGAIRLRMWRWR